MKMNDEEIFDILDGIASEEVIARHQKRLLEDTDYQQLFLEYASTHALLEEMPLEKTAVNFTDKLLDKWELAQSPVVVTQSSKLPLYFMSVMAVLAILVILVMLGLPASNKPYQFPVNVGTSVEFLKNKEFINGLVLINVLIALFFIDKKVFLPYFQQHHRVG